MRPQGRRRADLLSVSIVTYQTPPAAFLQSLESLDRAARELARHEDSPVAVTILDNGGEERALRDLVQPLQSSHCRYDVKGGLGNLGYGRAHNLAIKASPALYHLILNPDVVLDPQCLTKGVAFLRENPLVKAVAPHATDRQGNVQYLCKRFPTLFDLVLRGFAPEFLRKPFARRLLDYEMRESVSKGDVVWDIPIVSGCFMLCETALLKKVGGFDERFFLYFEDFALSMELKKHGLLAYLPDMRIQHFGGNSARKGLNHIAMFATSAIKFFNTYGWKFI